MLSQRSLQCTKLLYGKYPLQTCANVMLATASFAVVLLFESLNERTNMSSLVLLSLVGRNKAGSCAADVMYSVSLHCTRVSTPEMVNRF